MIDKNQNYKRIAIVKLSAMGDIIHAMVALQFIKEKFPNLIIDWFVEKDFSEILKYNPHIDNIYELNLKSIKKEKFKIFEQIALIKKYSKNNYDLVIDAQGLLKSAIVSKLLGKNVVGFDKNSIREKIASYFYKIKVNISYDKNVIERNVKIITAPFLLEISKEDILNKKSFIYFSKSEKIDKYISSTKRNILFIVGASWDSKMYPKEKFLELIKSLDENLLVTWGNEKEKEIGLYLSQNSNAIFLDKMNLNELKCLVSKMDLIIGGDTGPTHLAWASNVKSITLFGNTPAYRNTYETTINKVIQSNKKIDPSNIDKNDFSIKNIKVDDIYKMVKSLL